jgi:hypothetical protein
MIEAEDRTVARSTPTHAELERAIESVPGVAEAHVTTVAETGKSRLRIRLANDEDAESVSWSIAATLRERFGISLDPDQIRPRAVPTPLTDAGPTTDASQAGHGPTDDAGVARVEVAEGAVESAADDLAAAGNGVLVSGDRVLLSEAARALLEDAVAEAREAELDDEAREAELDDDADAAIAADEAASDGVVEAFPGSHGPADDDDAAAADGMAAGVAADTAATSPDADPAAAEPVAADPAAGPADADPADANPADVSSLADAHHDRDDGTRARIRHLDTRVDVSDVEVTATLGFGDREVTGSARAVATEQGILRAVAEATLQALSELTGERLVAGVDSVAASVSGQPPIATVIVSLVTDRGDEVLLGSSLVRKDPQRAVMRATLDALNRRVEPWLEVEIAG